jgi:hypothetical protein
MITGVFFFVGRDLAATVVFHNFLGTFGVVQALAERDALHTFARIQIPLIGTALLTAFVLAGGYWIMGRSSTDRDAS